MSRTKIGNIKLKVKRIIYYIKNDFFSAENTIIGIAAIICLILTINSITAISRNWQLSERLATERKNLALVELEIETLELENDYYRTDEYKEIAARKLANKKLPGENLVYLPPNSASAKHKHDASKVSAETKQISNFEKWITFLFANNR